MLHLDGRGKELLLFAERLGFKKKKKELKILKSRKQQRTLMALYTLNWKYYVDSAQWRGHIYCFFHRVPTE